MMAYEQWDVFLQIVCVISTGAELDDSFSVDHQCPALWLACATLSEEELSWAMCKIHSRLNVYNVCIFNFFKFKLKKAKFFFSFQSWDLLSNSLIKMGSTATCFSLFTGLCLADGSKCIHLFAVNPASTAPTPCPGFSSVLAMHWC